VLVTFTRNIVADRKGSEGKVEGRSVLLDRESLKPILDYRFQTAPYSAMCSQGTEFVVLRKSKDGFETSVLDKAQ
jgi:hypothetical protein